MGACQSAKQARGHWSGALEAGAAGTRCAAGVPQLLPPSGRPTSERTRPMWMYTSPMDPNCTLPEELAKDEVWSRLDRVLQLRAKETLEWKPEPLHASKLSNLVCSPLLILCPFRSCSPVILALSHPFRRDSNVTSPSRIFQRGQRAWLGKPP